MAAEDGPPEHFDMDANTGMLIKTPAATRTVVQYDFSTNTGLLDKYRNPWGYVRHGLLLEDLDALAGNTAAQHCADGDKSTLGPLLAAAAFAHERLQVEAVSKHDREQGKWHQTTRYV